MRHTNQTKAAMLLICGALVGAWTGPAWPAARGEDGSATGMEDAGAASVKERQQQPGSRPMAAERADDPAPAAELPQQPAAAPSHPQSPPNTQQGGAKPAQAADGLIPLQPEGNIWLDPRKKRVVMVGRVCLREGQLEMFACPQGTKEHESIVSLPVKAYVIHAALLALGAKPGSPTVFVPEFRPATGTRVDVSLYWTDENGKRRSAWAQDWVRHWRTGLPMQEHWVFAGSSFWVNERTGEKYYQAEEGFLICLANFSTAMLDIPVESSDAAGQLVFEAFTERIPPLGTRVTVVLTPRLEEGPMQGEAAPSEGDASGTGVQP
jgi:hypothetical protein